MDNIVHIILSMIVHLCMVQRAGYCGILIEISWSLLHVLSEETPSARPDLDN